MHLKAKIVHNNSKTTSGGNVWRGYHFHEALDLEVYNLYNFWLRQQGIYKEFGYFNVKVVIQW